MQIAKFKEIKEIFNFNDESYYTYSISETGTISIKKVNEYDLFAEEGLKEIYDSEPEGLWENCLGS